MNDDVTTEAVKLGLDPRGYSDPEKGRYVAWGAPATELGIEREGDEPYTVLDHLIDQAGALGMFLDEYLALDDD